MSTSDQRIQITCTTCQTPMSVPIEHSGKMAKCPNCQNTFTIPFATPTATPAPATEIPPVVQPPPTAQQVPMAQAPLAQQPGPYAYAQPQSPYGEEAPNSFPQLQTESMTDRAHRSAAEDLDMEIAVGVEKPHSTASARHRTHQRGRSAASGAIGGAAAMVFGAILFFGGLAAGRIMIYGPILFIAGLIGMISALAGGGSSRRRY